MADIGVSTLRLEPVLGPPVEPMVFTPDREWVLGRGEMCTPRLPEHELSVSRRHCRVAARGAAWCVADLGSRHGTFVNGARLEPEREQRLAAGDKVRIGPWVLRVADGREQQISTSTLIGDDPAWGERPVPISEAGRENINRRRLELLLDCAKRIHAAEDEAQLAQQILDALMEGTGYSVTALVRPGREGRADAVLGAKSSRRSASGAGPEATMLSRSLITAAARGQTVQMQSSTPQHGATIVSAGIRSALCVPVVSEGGVVLCLYLDSREGDPPAHADAAAFCQAVAEMCSLSLMNIRRTRLERERARYEEQMEAALAIQRNILPPARGAFGPMRYAMEAHPGRFVAGDLFDVMRLDDDRIAFFLGDVAGKGVPAAILMATTLSFLGASLRHHRSVARAMDEVNAHLREKAAEDKFVSMWCGVLDLRTGEVEFVDAGHGYWVMRGPDGRVTASGCAGAAPLRVEEAGFVAERCRMAPGSRIVLFSDGVVEQAAPAGTGAGGSAVGGSQFGLARVQELIAASGSPEEDVGAVVRSVREHAGGGAALGDDVTVASIAFDGAAPAL